MIDYGKSCLLLSICIAASSVLTFFVSRTAAAAGGQLDVGRADEWHFTATPYLWLAGIDGDVTVRGFESDVDVNFGDIVDVIDFGAIGHFEAKKGRWAIMSDLVYLKVSENADTPGPIISDIDVEVDTLVLEVGGAYTVYETDSNFFNKPMSLAVLGGIRYTHLEVDVDITAMPAIADVSGSKDWVDPFVGFRSSIHWTRRWSSSVRFDIGGFGVGSDLVYQIAAVQVYELNERLDFVFGYRWLDYDYDDGSGSTRFEFDTTLSGPLLGMNIKF